MRSMFIAPSLVSLFVFAAVWWWGGMAALILVVALAALEISLSFDNAVLNAKTLAKMSPIWQRRFLTWGILIAVFGMRFLLPIFIISFATFSWPWTIAALAFQNPEQYGALLSGVAPAIHVFGGMFLLMVALRYFFDEEKTVHWIRALEQRFARWGKIEAIELYIAIAALELLLLLVPSSIPLLIGGVLGIGLFILIEKIVYSLTRDIRSVSVAGQAAAGAALFLYLNVLDAAFSLDGVIGAFALTADVVIILAGLGIGAYFVRTFTVYLTQRNTISKFIYLEHGAHWAIFSLAICFFAGLFIEVPEVVPGSVGIIFAVLSFVSSRKERKTLGLE